MHVFKSILVVAVILGSGGAALARFGGNGAYAVTLAGSGPYYARCVPDDVDGAKGVTQILRVRKGGDEVLSSFDWYNVGGIVLGWSPTAEKVAVMRVRQDSGLEPSKQIEFSFYLGDKLVRSYTTAELVKLGAPLEADHADNERGVKGPDGLVARRATYAVQGCFNVWNTSDCYFKVTIGDPIVEPGRQPLVTLNFDIVTGKQCRIERVAGKDEERMVFVE